MHTTYSDGTGTHEDIARAALKAGIDAVIITDHNVLVSGLDGYRDDGKRRVLLLVGEEVHNQARFPQRSHLLVIGAGREMATFAPDPQRLIDQVNKSGGLSFLAHPHEHPLALVGDDRYDWEDWQVQGYTGLELWNGLSEFKSFVNSYPTALFYTLFPQFLAHGPHPKTLEKWDELLAQGKRVTAVGGSDAHELKRHLGPIHLTLYPYTFHFQCINNHVLVPQPPGEQWIDDRRMLLSALRQGNSFVGYDLPHPTRGFRFSAQGKDKTAIMGEEITLNSSVTLQIRMPIPAECHLLLNGKLVKAWQGREICSHIANQPGAYRVECFINYLGKRRGWIYSNPIYVK